MKKVLLVALVVLLVVIGLPVMMPGMGVAHCHDCTPGVAAGALCLIALWGALALVVLFVSQPLSARRKLMLGLLRASVFYRPPQTA